MLLQVQIFFISKLLENNIKPELEIDLKNWGDTDGVYSDLKPISAIEIFEELGEHHLFLTNTHRIYQVILK